MLSPQLRKKVDTLWTHCWNAGLANPLVAVEQITYLLFIRQLEGLDRERVRAGKPSIYGKRQDADGNECDYEACRWSNIRQAPTFSLLNDAVFPWLRGLEKWIKDEQTKQQAADAAAKGDSGAEKKVADSANGGADKLARVTGRLNDAYFVLDPNKGDTLTRAIGLITSREHGMAFDSHLMRVRFDHSRALAGFVHAFLASSAGRAAFLRQTRKSAVQFNINTEEFLRIRMPLPALRLQTAFLNSVDAVHGLDDAALQATAVTDQTGPSLLAYAVRGELTAAWRTGRAAELAAEAAERDAALRTRGVAVAAPARPAPAFSPTESRRDPRYAYLNRTQRALLAGIEKHFQAGCFTPETLVRELGGRWRGNLHAVEGHLAVLAVRGLVIAFSREERREDTGEVFYGTAYRLPTEEHESPDGESSPGDRMRAREIGRLGAQLEKERML